jgi:hypothetical protein
MECYIDVLGHGVLLLKELVDEVSLFLLALGDRSLSLDCLDETLFALFVLSVPSQVGGLEGVGRHSRGFK